MGSSIAAKGQLSLFFSVLVYMVNLRMFKRCLASGRGASIPDARTVFWTDPCTCSHVLCQAVPVGGRSPAKI